MEHSGCNSLVTRVLLKAHKGTIAKLINIPGLASPHMPCSYSSDLCCFVKQIESQSKRLAGIIALKYYLPKMKLYETLFTLLYCNGESA